MNTLHWLLSIEAVNQELIGGGGGRFETAASGANGGLGGPLGLHPLEGVASAWVSNDAESS